MKDFTKQFWNDSKTKEELINNIEICKTENRDFINIALLFHSQFDLPTERDAVQQLLYSNVNLNESVKLIDKRDGQIYGLLLFSNYRIEKGTPLQFTNEWLVKYLMPMTQLNGFLFIIDPRLRGERFDMEMLLYNKEYWDTFDLIWCAVDTNYNTHNYWKHVGFHEITNIPQATFYVKFKDKKHINSIFILKMLNEHAYCY